MYIYIGLLRVCVQILNPSPSTIHTHTHTHTHIPLNPPQSISRLRASGPWLRASSRWPTSLSRCIYFICYHCSLLLHCDNRPRIIRGRWLWEFFMSRAKRWIKFPPPLHIDDFLEFTSRANPRNKVSSFSSIADLWECMSRLRASTCLLTSLSRSSLPWGTHILSI